MHRLAKWWVRFLISLFIGVVAGNILAKDDVGIFGISVFVCATLYLGLSIAYGFSKHNHRTIKPGEDRDDLLDG